MDIKFNEKKTHTHFAIEFRFKPHTKLILIIFFKEKNAENQLN